MTEDEFRIIERKMAINRGEIESDQEIFDRVKKRMDDASMRISEGLANLKLASVEWPEHLIEAECTRLLEQDGWRSLRTDPVSDRGRGKGFGELGMADHLYIRYSCVAHKLETVHPGRADSDVLWIEFKSAKGKPAKHQTEWHTKERARGALTWIAGVDFPPSVQGFVMKYRQSGLNRGRV
jgi:hypothetical protein